MSIRYKILLVVLPLLVPPLVIGGVASALSARSGITAVAQEFLQFKAEELSRYAQEQWQLLVDNDLAGQDEYLSIAARAIESHARGMIRRDSELILALSSDGQPAFTTSPLALDEGELDRLAQLARQRPSGWHTVTLAGEPRVAQAVPFEPFGWVLFVTEQESVFYRAVRTITTQTALILAVTLIVAVVLSFLFTHSLLLPLSRMASTMREIIGERDLSQRVPILHRDEIGDLGHTFNVMTEELGEAYEQIKQYAFQAVLAQRQEQKIRNIFQKYVPIDVIDQFFANPESMLVGQNRTLAVLFSDIRSFTTIAERLPPDQIVESLNAYFSAMVDAVIARNGIVDKYIGDAIMAFFGAPVPHDNDAVDAVRAGMDMLAALKTFNHSQAEKGLPTFRIGMGINYGPVTIGNIGSEKKMDYTVVGDMVNLASRLEGLTKHYRLPLLISESVYRQVESEIPCRLVDTVTVKGKSQPNRIYAPATALSAGQHKAWQLQHKGLEHYYRREFTTATRYLLAAHRELPDDPVIRMFLLRCKHYIDSPPGPDWTGVTAIADK
ncbi:MAG: HAMP domain-containing protein [Spirochaetaceae bacterium]|nr:MAG: HAMP domain-containing protein [Spirochaetaceae bacterium]